MNLHQIIAYLFTFLFLSSFAIFVWSSLRKNQVAMRWGCMLLLGAYACFLVLYFHGFSLLKTPEIQASTQLAGLVDTHYKMAKFIFTTATLAALACIFILRRSVDEALPSWLVPNFLILYLTALTFLVRVFISAWRITG